MIISRTPLRISLAGGGTDLQAYYRRFPGAVVSTAIDKYIYITVNPKFDHRIRVSYSRTEIVDAVDEIRHELVREAMKLTGVTQGIEITSIADIPSAGTGLGSSSAFTVGLLNALYAYKGMHCPAERLAREACHIEIDILGRPIGKQDQYIAAYGGLQYIQFNPDDTVFVDPVICSRETKQRLQSNLMLFYTGITRSADDILREQQCHTDERLAELQTMKALADALQECLRGNGSLDEVGRLLHRGWERKKRLASGVTNDLIDGYYERALEAGALGGKVTGAGGGGFLLLYCPPERQEAVRQALRDLKETPFQLEPQGSKIIYVG